MELSTIGGFSFCGKMIKNDKLDMLLVSVDRDAMPDLSNPQAKRLVTINLGIYGKTATERKQKLRALLQDWVNKEGPLIFNDDEGLFFQAKLIDKAPVTDLNARMDGLTLIFECDRSMYSITEKTLTGTNISTMNDGNYEADTLFKCTANCTVTFGSVNFAVTNVISPVYVDSKRMVVYEIVNGKEVNKALDYTCNSPEYFIRIPHGTQATITSTSSVELKFRDTFIV